MIECAVKVAIHQPNYLPWLGFFEKIHSSNIFVVLDHVQHIRQSLTRRTRVRKTSHSNDFALLSIPLYRHDRLDRICDLVIRGTDWKNDHLNKFKDVYRNAPYFDEMLSLISTCLKFGGDGVPLAQFNLNAIQLVCGCLGIQLNYKQSSELILRESGSKLIAEIIQVQGGTCYYSGGGASEYMEENDFVERGLALSYQSFQEYSASEPYKQHQGSEFLNGLSVVDALFNLGAANTRQYIERYADWDRQRRST